MALINTASTCIQLQPHFHSGEGEMEYLLPCSPVEFILGMKGAHRGISFRNWNDNE